MLRRDWFTQQNMSVDLSVYEINFWDDNFYFLVLFSQQNIKFLNVAKQRHQCYSKWDVGINVSAFC